jgi:hypothetical protein
MQAHRAAQALRPLVEGDAVTATEALRRTAVALDAVQEIRRLMADAGAPVRG